MRALRWGFGALATLIAAAAVAAWIVPGQLDWDAYRGRLEALLSATAGRAVRIDGPVRVTLLPTPGIAASRIVSLDGALAAGEMRVDAAFWPLLSGRLAPRALVLSRPVLRLPWPLPPVARETFPATFSARIEDGRLIVGGVTLDTVAATLSSDESGAVVATGSARMFGRTIDMTARLTPPGGDGASGLNAFAEDRDALARGTFAGQVAANGAITGEIDAGGLDLSRVMPGPFISFRVAGAVSATTNVVTANDLRVELGGAPGRASALLRLGGTPRLDVAFATGRLDLDAWLPVIREARGRPPLPIGLDLSAEAAPLRGFSLRRVRAAIDLPVDGGAQLRDASAILPGDAPLSMAGAVVDGGFRGKLALDAPALATTLRWLRVMGCSATGAIPETMARNAVIKADLLASPVSLELSNIAGTLNDSPVRGSVRVASAPRRALAASLAIERLAIDPLTPHPLVDAPLDRSDVSLDLSVGAARWGERTIDRLSVRANAADGAVTVETIRGSLGAIAFSGSGRLDAKGAVQAGMLDLAAPSSAAVAGLLPAAWRETFAQLPGSLHVHATASGLLSALAMYAIGDIGDLHIAAVPIIHADKQDVAGGLALRHPDAQALIGFLGGPATPWLGDGPLRLDGLFQWSNTQAAVTRLTMTAGALRADGTLALGFGKGAPALTGAIVANVLPLPAIPVRSRDVIPFAVLRGWTGDVQAQAATILIDRAPSLTDVAARLRLADGKLSMTNATGRWSDGALHAEATLNASADGPPTLSLSSVVNFATEQDGAAYPFALVRGMFDATANLTATGYSPAAMLDALGGTVAVSAHDGTLSGVDLTVLGQALGEAPSAAALAVAVRDALSHGTTAFDRLAARANIARGAVTIEDAGLSGPSGLARLSGGLTLSDMTLDARLVARPSVAGAPEFAVTLTGPLAAPARVPEMAGVARWVAGGR